MTSQPTEYSCLLIMAQEPSLDVIVQKFFELEEIPDDSQAARFTPEQQHCEKVFNQTVTRLPLSRLKVSLPLKSSLASLGSSSELYTLHL